MKAEMSIKVKLKVSHLSATKYVDVGIFKTRTFGDKPTLCLWSQPGSSVSTYFFSYATLALPKQAKCKTRIDKIERYKKQGRHKGGKLRKNNYNWNVERESRSNKAACRKAIHLTAKGTCYHTTESILCTHMENCGGTSGTFAVSNI